ncbi:MAG: beta-ketoacyl-ACP reductase [Candidatus Methylomirabilia bacterium]
MTSHARGRDFEELTDQRGEVVVEYEQAVLVKEGDVMRLQEKVALITGAAGGIGEATAKRFIREGAHVAVNDANAPGAEKVAQEIQRAGGKAMALAGDVTKKTQVEEMVRQVTSAWGRVDILINNAGINRDAMAAKMNEGQWDEVLDVNLKGTFLCAQAVLPGMRERGWGRVINTSSIGSLGNIGQANYAASKAGVIGLTKTLALEYAKYGVTVNCVAPGATMTAMLAGIPDQIKAKIIEKIPVGRIADPAEIAHVHGFLASEEASFITGQVIFVAGGMSVGFGDSVGGLPPSEASPIGCAGKAGARTRLEGEHDETGGAGWSGGE